ncbi:DNRLRE domain-containing protein [Dehalococcoidia bacterium]|nr:DNRLRE domain-containing protein [Dehalococcoidia bacterium]
MRKTYLAGTASFAMSLVLIACVGQTGIITPTPIPSPVTGLRPTSHQAPPTFSQGTSLQNEAAGSQIPGNSVVPSQNQANLTRVPTSGIVPRPTALLAPSSQELTEASSPIPTVVTTVGAAKDNTLYEDPEGDVSNGQGMHLFSGNNNDGQRRRTLLEFDIAGAVPAGSRISAVTLTLNVSRARGNSTGFDLYLMLQDWGEGSSDAAREEGGGAVAGASDATWVRRGGGGLLWVSLGGDFVDSSSGSSVVSTVGAYSWGSTPEMVADVQGWLDLPATNFGWIVIGGEDMNQSAKRFDSRENPSIANRPALVIEYMSLMS